MAKTRAQKEEILKQINDKLARAKSVVFADYKGLTMKQLSELRDKLYEQQAEFTITKNTLLSRALTQRHPELGSGSNQEIPKQVRNDDGLFSGPTATLFAYDDEISPIKLLVKTLRDAGIGKVKAGFLGADFL